jgi:biotin carboxylase
VTPRLLLLVPTSTYRARAFVRAARRLSVDLSLASEVPSALAELHPVDLPSFDFSQPDAVTAFIESFAADHPIDAVVAVDDQATMAAAMIATALGLRGNRPDAVYATLNKYRTRLATEAAGVASPRYRLIHVDDDPRAVAGTLDYPVVIKPLMMAASRGVIRADDPGAFADAFVRVGAIVTAQSTDAEARSHVLVEEYIPGWEVAVEGMVHDGAVDIVAVFDKPDPLEGPYFPETIYTTPSRLSAPELDAVAAVTRDAVTALGIRHGPIHAELRGEGARAVLIEIAARSIGGLCSKVVRFHDGRSLEDIILLQALGAIDHPPPREDAAAGVMMLQAPAHGLLERVDGTEDAAAVDGVEEVIISAHPGRELSPLPEGFLYLGFIFARGDTPESVEASLRTAHARLDVVMR